MRFFASASAILAFAATALAQTADFDPINAPNEHEVVPAGKTYTVTWDAPAKYADGTVSISLIGGEDANTLVPIKDIATGVKNSAKSYSWAVDPSLGAEKAYGLVFKYESDPSIMQYSKSFKIGSAKGNDGKGKGKVSTILSATGVKTVTLTSCPVTTSSPTSTPITTHHNTTTPTPTPAKPTQTPTFITSLPAPPPVNTAPVAPVPSSPAAPVAPTPSPGAGAHLVAGPFALVAAMGMAFLAL